MKENLLKVMPLIFSIIGLLISGLDCLIHVLITNHLEAWTLSSFILCVIGYLWGIAFKKSLSKAYSDNLTGINNSRYFQRILNRYLGRKNISTSAISLAMIDIDEFKTVNDTHGHKMGDKLIKEVSLILKNSVRKSDYVFRWGGDEFAIIFPNTESKEAYIIAKRTREIIESKVFYCNNIKIRSTVSIGITSVKGMVNIELFIELADKALYKAKSTGRNKVYVIE